MDIEIELEILIDKHKGKQVGLGEIRLDWFAEDCLKEIRRLKSAIARQSVKSEEVQEAMKQVKGELDWYALMSPNTAWSVDDIRRRKNARTIIAALQAYQPWVSVEDEKPESGKHVLLCCEVRPSGKRYVCDGFYAQSKTITTICDGDNNYEYDEETDEFYLIEGYYEIIKNWDDYSSIVIDDFVTHWCPLPEPPKGE